MSRRPPAPLRAVVAAAALLACSALAQQSACPAATEVTSLHLYGLWAARIDQAGAAPRQATVLFERSRDYIDGLAGAISRDGSKSLVAGDVDDGVFTLEESADGRTIDGIWQGRVVEGSCGKLITGQWRRAGSSQQQAFELRKHEGWQ